MDLKIGDKIKDFKLENHYGKEVDLNSIKKKKVLFSFHPLAWTPVCIDQMRSLEREFERLKEKGIDEVYGVSVDAQPGKGVWAKSLGIENIKLLCDFEPKGEFSKSLGLYNKKMGTSERANVVVENGKVSFIKKYEISTLPDIEELIKNI